MLDVRTRLIDGGAGGLCESILAELPQWFGIPEANADYVERANDNGGVVGSVDGVDVGITTIIEHGVSSAEIYLMAVRPGHHRGGIGRAMLAAAEDDLGRRGIEFLQVKTLSPLRPDANYAATRAFYEAYGFRVLEEHPQLWGPENPALQLIKAVERRDRQLDRPTVEIEGCKRAHERLFAALDRLPDDVAARPSLLPGWSVADVLAHIDLNAQAMIRRIEATLVGDVIEQYPGGPAGRSELIERAAARTTAKLIESVRSSAVRLDELFASLATEAWNLPVRTVAGGQHPVAHLPFRRWREVEMHHVDLGVGFDVSEVSPSLVDLTLPRLLEGLPERTDRRTLTMWLLGRGDAPTLDPWG